MTYRTLWQRMKRLISGGKRPPSAPRRRAVLEVEMLEDRLTPASVNFAVTQDWGSGFQANLTITNPAGAAPVVNWQLQFDYAATISSIWDAAIVSHVGTHYVIANGGWNSTIAANSSVSFGFVASPGNTTAAPTNYLLNSAPPVTPPPPPVPPPPAPPPAPPPSAGPVQYSVTSDWGSGFQASVTLTSTGSSTLTNWSLTFDFAGQISSIWNASISSHVANHYVITNLGWNGTINAGASTSFGFVASPGGGTVAPANFVLSGTGGGGTGTGGTGGSGSGTLGANTIVWPAHYFAPYVDMTLYPTYNLVSAAQNQGIKFFTLAFVVADATNNSTPSWGGYSTNDINGGAFDTQLRTQIAGLRGLGGDVLVSFGGANGQELAQTITNVSTLTNAYQSVINAYQLTHIDFDIEGAAVADHASIDRRSQALAAVEQQAAAAGKPLSVWFTLPVLPTGLTNDGLYVLQSALHYGVKIGGVNVMAMDYGDWAAPSPQGQMGTYAIDSAVSLFKQLQGLYGSGLSSSQLWQMVGITPMIGLNDVTTETFTQADARQLLAWAQQQGIGRLSMWSLNRDQQAPSGALNYVTPTASSLVQQPFEFSKIFEPFSG